MFTNTKVCICVLFALDIALSCSHLIRAYRLLLRHECLQPRFTSCRCIRADPVTTTCVTLFLLVLILLPPRILLFCNGWV
eukprot:COSAG02_NODE_5434_length_4333_cov_4.508266_2_plen_80_part_00